MADCPRRHGLRQFSTHHRRFKCDVCRRSMALYQEMWGCRSCNYDLCRTCYDIENNMYKPQQTEIEVELEGQRPFVSCPGCGRSQTHQSNFCSHCGQAIGAFSPEHENAAQRSNMKQPLINTAHTGYSQPSQQQSGVVIADTCFASNCRNVASFTCASCNNRVCYRHTNKSRAQSGTAQCIWCQQSTSRQRAGNDDCCLQCGAYFVGRCIGAFVG